MELLLHTFCPIITCDFTSFILFLFRQQGVRFLLLLLLIL